MWPVQNKMESMANDESLNSTEEEIFSQVLRGHRSGHVRGMGGVVSYLHHQVPLVHAMPTSLPATMSVGLNNKRLS